MLRNIRRLPVALLKLLAKRFSRKTRLGLTERVVVFGLWKNKTVTAKIDTGATKSSIDAMLARELGLGPVVRTAVVRTTHGIAKRDVVVAKVKIGHRIIVADFTVAKRSHMKYGILIGQNILKRGFIIDPSKG
ncbi:MAG: RimK/LysX family protein [Candidatus Woesearchaeota archaeon]